MKRLNQRIVIASATAAGALLAVVMCAASTGSAQTDGRVGKFVIEAAPRPPLFPSGPADCQSYSEALSAFQRDVSGRHQSCLDTSDHDCPDDRSTGCECHTCAPFHGGVSHEGVTACYQAVRDADARLQRVNQVVSSVGASSGELLVRGLIGEQIRRAMGDSQLLKDLGRVSALAHNVDRIRQGLMALRDSVNRGDTASPASHLTDILQELSRRGLSRSPVALLMTDIALEYVGRIQSDALVALDAELTAIRRDLEAQYSSSKPAAPADGCEVLVNEQANRELKDRDSAAWLTLVTRCNPQ